MRNRFFRPLATTVLGMFSAVAAATAGGAALTSARVKTGTKKTLVAKQFNIFDAVHDQRVKFAAHHGVADPSALVAAVRHSPMANLLISVAIEESRGDPVAVGSAGEQGAWQVKASDWGAVPKDIHGQAGQAEKIIRNLLMCAKGNKKKALARYNGGTTPPGKSYRYAERILKRAGNLHGAAIYNQPNFKKLQEALLAPPRSSGLLT